MELRDVSILHFREQYFERIWGARRLETLYGKPLPPEKSIGEAWLISDHASAVSVVDEGSLAGVTLHELLESNPSELLGAIPQPTIHGRFPLLLKLLDAQDVLSVQVHPDDACAKRLGEPDVGKTEMWHVLHADIGSELFCGLLPGTSPQSFRDAIDGGSVEDALQRFQTGAGDSVYVPAGTVHAIGKGIVLAEIQQNSDITYRVFDWNRVDGSGKGRELHAEKALEATRFSWPHPGRQTALELPVQDSDGRTFRAVLAACTYFAAELVRLETDYVRHTNGQSFHLVLCRDGEISVTSGEESGLLGPGDVVMTPGHVTEFRCTGAGSILDYYVPDLMEDIVKPLRMAGHTDEAVARLMHNGR